MRLLAASVALLIAITGTANAASPEKGGYVGLNLGVLAYDPGNLPETGKTTDDTDYTYGVYGGFKFNRYFALEGRIVSLGEHKYAEDREEINADFSAITINAVGFIPLGQSNFDLMGQVGVGSGHYKFKFLDGNSYSGNEGTYTFGIGARWAIIPALTVQATLDAYGFSSNENDTKVDNKFGAANIGVQWNF